MCESCENNGFNQAFSRRNFLKTGSAFSGAALLTSMSTAAFAERQSQDKLAPIEKKKARLKVVFMYPPAEVVIAGQLEDSWAPHRWFTYPGNQFNPEKNHQIFKEKIAEFAAPLNMEVEFVEPAIYTKAAVAEFTAKVNADQPDALLIVNFWNTFSPWVLKMTQDIQLPIIIYHPVGANHQHPPKGLMSAEGVYYIHSVRNWPELDGAIRAVNAKKVLSQSRLIRIGDFDKPYKAIDSGLGVEIVGVPAEEYNNLFDSIKINDKLVAEATAFKAKALEIIMVEDNYIIEGFRAHKAVQGILKRYGADSVTIKCLMLEERKPCIGFSLLNSALVPCACEDCPDSAMSMMLGGLLFDRGGFMHNPEFDINYNQYYGSHCTSALELYGPGQGEVKFKIRPFTHQLPQTAALDLQFEPGERIFVIKYIPPQNTLFAYTGEMVGSTDFETAGGCASRFLMKVDKLEDVCSMYHGPHPILYYGDIALAKRLKTFAKLYKMTWAGNI